MANLNLNIVTMGGRLTSDPELRQLPSGTSCTSFTIAINRGKDETDFFDVTAFAKTAETVCRYFKKGSCIALTGEIHRRSWEDKQGNKRVSYNILAGRVFFVDSKGDFQSADVSAYAEKTADMIEVDTTSDDGLPF